MRANPDTDPFFPSAAGAPASICLVLFLLLAAPALSGEEAPLFALKAWRVLDGTGHTYEDGVVVVQGGRIDAVGDESIVHPACPIHDLGKVYLCPGLIDLFTGLGAERHLAETASSVQTEATAEDLFHPFHEDFERALACGITTAVLAPNGLNLVGGRAVVEDRGFGSRETNRLRRWSCGDDGVAFLFPARADAHVQNGRPGSALPFVQRSKARIDIERSCTGERPRFLSG